MKQHKFTIKIDLFVKKNIPTLINKSEYIYIYMKSQYSIVNLSFALIIYLLKLHILNKILKVDYVNLTDLTKKNIKI